MKAESLDKDHLRQLLHHQGRTELTATQFQAHCIQGPAHRGAIRLAVKMDRWYQRAEQEAGLGAGELEVAPDDQAFTAPIQERTSRSRTSSV